MIEKAPIDLKKYQKKYNKKYRLINKEKIKIQKKEYYEKNKEEINKKKREKRAIEKSKKKIEKYKICTNCKKKLKKNEKNFRYKSKLKGILTFRQPCRSCEMEIRNEWGRTEIGKQNIKKYEDNYKLSGKKKLANARSYKKNKKKINKRNVDYRRNQRKNNPVIWIQDNISSRLKMALKEENLTKRNNTYKYIGCSIKDFKDYLEKYFVYDKKEKKTYSWLNRGRGGWDIDHIVPLNYFKKNYDFTDFEVQKICWHYSNLRPLWAKENRNIKREKIDPTFAEKKIRNILKLINKNK